MPTGVLRDPRGLSAVSAPESSYNSKLLSGTEEKATSSRAWCIATWYDGASMSIWESYHIASRSRKDGERRKGTDQLEVDFVANQVNRGAASKRPLEFVVVRNDTVPWHDEQGILFVGLERFLLDEQAVDLWASFPGRTMGPAALSGGVFGISGTGRGKSRGAFGRGCAPPRKGRPPPDGIEPNGGGQDAGPYGSGGRATCPSSSPSGAPRRP